MMTWVFIMSKKISLSNITAGFIAVLVGFSSSAALIFQAATTAGATSAEISSWVLALGVGTGISCIGLSLYYRMPILTAWSTPGAALLTTGLSGVSMPEAIGAFIFSALLIIVAGVTGWFERVLMRLPRALTAAMLAGILLRFGLNVFITMQEQFLLICMMFISYLFAKRYFSRYTIPIVLLVGVLGAAGQGLLQWQNVHLAISSPVFTMPVFSWSALLSIGIPLFLVNMTSQNIPGVAALHHAGYHPPISPLISWTGITNFLLAPFGGYAFNLAAFTAAICMSEEAGKEPTQRYRAAVCAGFFYFICGIFGATVVALLSAFPRELVLAVAGFALFGTIANSLKAALEEEKERESALITFLVSASGISLWGIGAAFWGLIAGVLSLVLLTHYKVSSSQEITDLRTLRE